MAKVYEFLANGFEEIEALVPVDILRRGGVDIQTVSITGSEFVESSHGVTVKADMQFTTPDDYADADMLLLPGGLPGATNLNDHEGVRQTLLNQHQRGRRIGAICAATQAGYRVPEDISVVGYDDVEMARFASPPLTTIRHPKSELGQLAVELLISRIRNKELSVEALDIQPELVIRHSVAAPRG